MNISPINLVNFKSSVRNSQNSMSAKEVRITSATNNANVSSEALKANFCPQIAFRGEEDSNDKKVKLSKNILSVLDSYVKSVTGERISEILANKFRTGIATEEDLFQTLNLKKDKKLVAQHLADYSFNEYINITKKLGYKNKLALLKTAQDEENKFTIAHSLAINPDKYEKATRNLSKKDRLDLLKMKDSFGRSVAYLLANEASCFEYLEPLSAIIGGFTRKDIINLLSIEDSHGKTVEDKLGMQHDGICLTVLKNIFEIK